MSVPTHAKLPPMTSNHRSDENPDVNTKHSKASREHHRAQPKDTSMRINLVLGLLLFITPVNSFIVIPRQQTTTVSSSRKVTTCFAKNKNLDKDVYRPEKVNGQDFDAIVIGSGIGGLTAASLIAQAGKKVLVLEQHYVAGGACHVFQHKGYRFATGIHYVGEMGNDDTDMNGLGLQVSLKRLLDSVAPAQDPILWDRMDGTLTSSLFLCHACSMTMTNIQLFTL